MIRILYITNPGEDYLADSVLHGLRHTDNVEVIDFPKKEVMYANYDPAAKLYGRGFTLYRTLPDIAVDRADIDQKIKSDYFDLVIFSSIHRQADHLLKYSPYLRPNKTVIIDGEDHDVLYSQVGGVRSFLKVFFNTQVRRSYYFKRELTQSPKQYLFSRLFCISFGFPEEKICPAGLPLQKHKDFPEHIVDKELFASLGRTESDVYKFEHERDYYRDLQVSRFGITTRKGGWDCMRHYEIAANRALMCFRDLDEKPVWCAPQGLQNGVNCIIYKNSEDLQSKTRKLDDKTYQELLHQSDTWIRNKTTKKIAHYILEVSR